MYHNEESRSVKIHNLNSCSLACILFTAGSMKTSLLRQFFWSKREVLENCLSHARFASILETLITTGRLIFIGFLKHSVARWPRFERYIDAAATAVAAVADVTRQNWKGRAFRCSLKLISQCGVRGRSSWSNGGSERDSIAGEGGGRGREKDGKSVAGWHVEVKWWKQGRAESYLVPHK